jgi:hypothetical protein
MLLLGIALAGAICTSRPPRSASPSPSRARILPSLPDTILCLAHPFPVPAAETRKVAYPQFTTPKRAATGAGQPPKRPLQKKKYAAFVMRVALRQKRVS